MSSTFFMNPNFQLFFLWKNTNSFFQLFFCKPFNQILLQTFSIILHRFFHLTLLQKLKTSSHDETFFKYLLMDHVQIKRAYEKRVPSDGYRVLVDDLWPRGLTKEKAQIDLWIKGIGPSTELRKWYAHDESKWLMFKRKYKTELQLQHNHMVKHLLEIIDSHPKVTLIYSSKSPHNNAVVLDDYLRELHL